MDTLAHSRPGRTEALLACGAAAGPLFIATVLVQDYTRAGVDPREQPLSLLTLGGIGWVQIGAFVAAGLLNIAFAAGISRATPHRRGAQLIGGYGLGLIAAGTFLPDPAHGFPPGTPAGPATGMSLPARLHDIAALVVFGCLVGATAVFARRFAARGERIQALTSAAAGVAVLVLVVVSMDPGRTSEALRGAVLVGWGWASWLAFHLRTSLPQRRP